MPWADFRVVNGYIRCKTGACPLARAIGEGRAYNCAFGLMEGRLGLTNAEVNDIIGAADGTLLDRRKRELRQQMFRRIIKAGGRIPAKYYV